MPSWLRSCPKTEHGEGGQAHFAPRAPQNEPVPVSFGIEPRSASQPYPSIASEIGPGQWFANFQRDWHGKQVFSNLHRVLSCAASEASAARVRYAPPTMAVAMATAGAAAHAQR